ncbi:MAG: four helix bundle protein [Bacteroidia bacterium]|nr:four helix bundle protein [Bacteroidia bacterium]MBP7727671.1 four helix bundle protein [Bacteroidia bacterium]MBP7772403.1 four helix bundle protein [Bacteroidia bacterium]
MATIERFEDLKVWQEARVLANLTYRISSLSNFQKDFVLRDQVRRAVVSTLSNIAEGFERNSPKEFIHFLSIAKGSAGELRSQLYLALDQHYIDNKQFKDLYENVTTISKMLSGLMTYLQNANLRKKNYQVSEPEALYRKIIIQSAKANNR